MNKQLILIALIGATLSANAQLDLGGKAGLNYHFQSAKLGDQAPAGSERPQGTDGFGFHVGAFLQAELSDKIFLRPELLFSTRTSTENIYSRIEVPGMTTEINSESTGTLSYIELPILAGYKLSDKFSLHVGPALGLLMSNKVVVSGSQSVTTGGQTVNTSLDATNSSTDGLNTVELAGVLGLGYQAGGLDFGLRYWQGFTPLEENTDLTRTTQGMVQFSVGYRFLKG